MATSHGSNPLVEPADAESSPQVRVHPMVLLAQNDHATRSTIRQHGPIIGAVLGSTDGQDVSMDIAFECGSKNMGLQNGVPVLSKLWFDAMLKLCQ
jgi:COP9 signalosome complex subunit 6